MKPVLLNEETHRELSVLKAKLNCKTFDELLNKLMEGQK